MTHLEGIYELEMCHDRGLIGGAFPLDVYIFVSGFAADIITAGLAYIDNHGGGLDLW